MTAGLVGPALLRVMPGSSCGVPGLEQGPCCAGDSFPPGGTAGAASGSQAAQSRLQHGAALGLSPAPPWAGQDQCPQGETQPAPLGTSPRTVQQQESLGCLSVGDTELRDVPPGGWGHLGVTAGTVLAVGKGGKGRLGDGQLQALTQPLLSCHR